MINVCVWNLGLKNHQDVIFVFGLKDLSQVSPQQKLVLILPTPQGWKAESALVEKKVTLGSAGVWTRDLVVGRQRSYHCSNHAAVYHLNTKYKMTPKAGSELSNHSSLQRCGKWKQFPVRDLSSQIIKELTKVIPVIPRKCRHIKASIDWLQ